MENGNANHPRYRAAKRLLEGSARLAGIFRRQNTAFVQRGVWLTPLLDGLVEPFLRKLAEELIAVRPDPAAPWSRAGGVLRFSPQRGEELLLREIYFLRGMLHDAVEPLNGEPADEEVLDFVNAAIDVLHEGALDEGARLAGRAPRHGVPRFGGVVLLVHEDPRLVVEAFAPPETLQEPMLS
ncbi:hypothetical protein [Vulgatibacter sp.]|uniref:hypothetical protein n=1 Tax=Vulgatibacter sp. TaxID=1971226 RepID=UPI003563867C